MNTIGIIGAMDEEVTLLKDAIEIVTIKSIIGLEFILGKISGKNIVVVRSGIGKVNAAICAQVLIDHFAVDCIINIGVAGAIKKDLGLSDVVISTDAIHHDFDTTAFDTKIGEIPRMDESIFLADETLIKYVKEIVDEEKIENVHFGRIASGDQFISSSSAKEKIWSEVQGYCAEMEGAAIAHTCYLNKLPFLIVRCISDAADDDANFNYQKFVVSATKTSSDLAMSLIKKF